LPEKAHAEIANEKVIKNTNVNKTFGIFLIVISIRFISSIANKRTA